MPNLQKLTNKLHVTSYYIPFLNHLINTIFVNLLFDIKQDLTFLS